MLIPGFFKWIGWALFPIGLLLTLLVEVAHYAIPLLNYNGRTTHVRPFANEMDNFTDEIGTTALIAGLIFIGFAKLKNEIAVTRQIRWQSLYWAVVTVCSITAAFMCLMSFGPAKSIERAVPTFPFLFLVRQNFASILFVFVLIIYC